ncbi:MAG: NYN domain-containing protein [Patescibacteria group bacterium]
MDNSKNERVAVFIDGDNFFDILDIIRQRRGINIDIQKLVNIIIYGRPAEKKLMMISASPDGRIERSTHATIMSLRQNGFQVITVLQTIQNNPEKGLHRIKGYSDCQLVCEMIKSHEQYDTAIIVTRDGDFRFVAQLLSDSYQKRIEICGIPICMNPLLLNHCDKYWNILALLQRETDITYQGKYEEADIEDEELTGEIFEEESPNAS